MRPGSSSGGSASRGHTAADRHDAPRRRLMSHRGYPARPAQSWRGAAHGALPRGPRSSASARVSGRDHHRGYDAGPDHAGVDSAGPISPGRTNKAANIPAAASTITALAGRSASAPPIPRPTAAPTPGLQTAASGTGRRVWTVTSRAPSAGPVTNPATPGSGNLPNMSTAARMAKCTTAGHLIWNRWSATRHSLNASGIHEVC
jgi:hypothetical protein